MSERIWTIYLSGEIHSDWREQIAAGVASADLPVHIDAPVTVHEDSDDCGVAILGSEDNKFWHDHKGAQMNAIRTRTLIADADIMVVRFGDKYRQLMPVWPLPWIRRSSPCMTRRPIMQ